MKLRLGTRGSDLARTQSETVADSLRAAGHDIELVVIRTAGDRSLAPSFGSIGAQGVFVREIEQALLAGEVDLAVHSFKDLPTASPAGLVIGAVPPREDPADVLLVAPGAYDAAGAEGLTVAAGARVGTSSMRRTVWLEHLRPDLSVQPLRGNVPTRIGKLRDGGYDAIVLAAAGLARLSAPGGALAGALENLNVVRLDPRRFVPAPAQGALAVQCRAADPAVVDVLAALDHPQTRAAVAIEREALRRAEGGCNTAFGAHCVATEDGRYRMTAMLERAGRILFAAVGGESADATVDALWQMIDAETRDDEALG
jgi:hydroxymethylbilane synthase